MSTPTSPIPSLSPARSAFPAAPDTPMALPASPQLLDLLLQAIWLMAQEVYARPALAQAMSDQAPALAGELRRASQSGAPSTQFPPELDGFAALDALARFGVVDLSFPYPSSPRMDSVGGARRIAPDGSPGIPAAWVRWMTQPRIYDERHDHNAPHAPLLLAVAWMMRYEPDLWRLYASAVIEGVSKPMLAARERLTPGQVYRRLTRARALLLTHIGYFTGVTTLAEYEQMLQALTRSLREPAEPAERSLG